MHRRLLLVMTAFPLLAQAGCTQEDTVALLMVVLQAILASLIPALTGTLLGGVGTGLFT